MFHYFHILQFYTPTKKRGLLNQKQKKKKSKTKIITNKQVHKFIYITNISHKTQSDKDQVHKFIYIYIYIYILLILATSHKVTKTKFLIKPKQLNQRLGQLVSQKSHLGLIICQRLIFTNYSHNSVLTSYYPSPTIPTLFLYRQIGRDTSELQSLLMISYAVFCL